MPEPKCQECGNEFANPYTCYKCGKTLCKDCCALISYTSGGKFTLIVWCTRHLTPLFESPQWDKEKGCAR